MAAGYMIFHNQINDQEMMGDYISRVVPTLVQYNAEVLVPGGHRVKLKREAGVWRIQDFD